MSRLLLKNGFRKCFKQPGAFNNAFSSVKMRHFTTVGLHDDLIVSIKPLVDEFQILPLNDTIKQYITQIRELNPSELTIDQRSIAPEVQTYLLFFEISDQFVSFF